MNKQFLLDACLYSIFPNMTHAKMLKRDFPEYINGSLDREIDSIKTWMAMHKIQISCFPSYNYHKKFLKISKKPYLVYFIGDLSILDMPILGVVGPREPSHYIRTVMSTLSQHLKKSKLVTISGGAKGVDTLLHTISLDARCPTIMVLGEGLRCALQSSKRGLIQKIVQEGGLVLSDFPLDQSGQKRTYPVRNRIIACLSTRLFIPGCSSDSGTMITIKEGVNANIPMYISPGPLFDKGSEGSNMILSQGKATMLVGFDELFTGLDSSYSKHQLGNYDDLSADERILIEHIDSSGVSLQYLCEKTGRQGSKVLSVLMLLELNQKILQRNLGEYALIV